MHQRLWEMLVIIASSLNYVSAYLLSVIWQLDLSFYLPLIFAISFFIGTLIGDAKKSFICTFLSLGIGTALAAAIVSLPPVLLGERLFVISASLAVAFSSFSRLIIIGLVVNLLGVLLGSLLSEELL